MNGVCTTDGEGDYEHGKRMLSLLTQLPGEPMVFNSISICGNGVPADRSLGENNLTLNPTVPADINIIVSYYCVKEKAKMNLYISEYDSRSDLLTHQKDIIWVPLGLEFSLGYMKPSLPINLEERKESLYNRLSQKWKNLISFDRDLKDTVFVLGYYSPHKDFSVSILNAFANAPFAHGKDVLFFVKGDENQVRLVQECFRDGSHHVITTTERIPDEDWHIMSQLADASIATGDSSCSDPFFFRTLPLWRCHKTSEAKSWNFALKEWASPENIDKERLFRYINLLGQKDERLLSEFVGEIDQKFIDDWKQFAAYIEEKYTLTSVKLSTVIDIANQIYLSECSAYSDEEHFKVLGAIDNCIQYFITRNNRMPCFWLQH